jgi:hypothetical protein
MFDGSAASIHGILTVVLLAFSIPKHSSVVIPLTQDPTTANYRGIMTDGTEP